MAIAVMVTAAVILSHYVIFFNPSTSPLAAYRDTDNDGYVDENDRFPNDNEDWDDEDRDGFGDNSDEFPYDPNEWNDTDGDGFGDNSDAFPTDPSEHADADGDGVGDNSDVFPTDPNEHLDSDDDGVGDNADCFPMDPTQWADRDNDSYGDNPIGFYPDEFPDNPNEWNDTDGDGFGDNSDAFPTDPSEHADADGDGVGDNADFYDSGNGKIRISIDSYQGDGTADTYSYGDPFFFICMDANMDGTYELINTSQVFLDTESLTNPFNVTFDIPDGTLQFKFYIAVFDSDSGGDQSIDYNPSGWGPYYLVNTKAPGTQSWDYNGSYDYGPEIDCRLAYSMMISG
jgi:hypothetical protein